MSRKLGRPSRISRDAVLDAGVDVAMADPAGAVSIGAIARHLRVTPMAIYTYFSSKDELMQALSQRLLEGLDVTPSTAANPAERIRAWAYGIQRHFVANPALMQMLTWEGGHNSVAWLDRSACLISALEELGLKDEVLAKAILWIWGTVLGAVQFEIYDRQTPSRMNAQELAELSEVVRPGVGKVDAFLQDDNRYQNLFDFQMDRMMDGLMGLAA
ncbi:MAG TPA: TetR/AcrR family transcriptional regulator [Sphingobium sp.]|nr:TetR/AcrR family transcriptional regulator [Sphingobium sp.]